MDIASVIISIIAIALSCFTFYWTTLRDKKALYLLRIDSLATVLRQPEFALINGGTRDILITQIQCGFESEDSKSASFPRQKIDLHNKSDSFVLRAGDAFHCKAKFLEQYESEFARIGKKEKNGSYTFDMLVLRVDIEWAELNGTEYQKSVKIYKYGINVPENVTMGTPLTKKHNLYKLP